jgi:hypothetical protein
VLPVCVLQDKASSNILYVYILPCPFVPGTTEDLTFSD